MDKYDHQAAEKESIKGASPHAEDDFNSQERAAAKRMGAVMDEDPDLFTLHAIMDSVRGLDQDADVRDLRTLVKDANSKRLHAALDRVLTRARERRCAGDRFYGRRP